MLEIALREHDFSYETIDISTDTTLLETYGVRIPVLKHPSRDTELNWPFTPEQILDWLEGC